MTISEFNPRTLISTVKRNYYGQYVEIDNDYGLYYVYVSIENPMLRVNKQRYTYSITFENKDKEQEKIAFETSLTEKEVLDALLKFKEDKSC